MEISKKLCRFGMFYGKCERFNCCYILDTGGCSQQITTETHEAIRRAGITYSSPEDKKQHAFICA